MEVIKRNRHYIVPSVATIIPSVTEIIQWNRSGYATEFSTDQISLGVLVHNQLEKIIKNNTLETILKIQSNDSQILKMDKEAQNIFFNLQECLNKTPYEYRKNTKLRTEVSFYHPNGGYPYVGTCDLLVEYPNGQNIIFDYKTGSTRKVEYTIQLAGYAKYFAATEAFALYNNEAKNVDLETNLILWENEVKNYYSNKDTSTPREVITEPSEELEKKINVLIKVLRRKKQLEKIEESLKENINNLIEDKNVSYSNLTIYHTKEGVSKKFPPDFAARLKLHYANRLIEEKKSSSCVYRLKGDKK